MSRGHRFLGTVAWAIGAPMAGVAEAQFVLSQGSYVQDFSLLPTTSSSTWTNNSTLPGWYVYQAGTPGTSGARDAGSPSGVTTITANVGTATAGGLYSYGGSSLSCDRALGFLNTNTQGDFESSLVLQNDLGSTITSVYISYVGEQWRVQNNNNPPDRLVFDYQVFSSAPNPASDLIPSATTGYTAVSGLDFISPRNSATAASLDGNQPANRSWRSSRIGGLAWQDSQYLVLRWWDDNAANSDNALAVDDLAVVVAGGDSRILTWDADPGVPEAQDGDGTWADAGLSWHDGSTNSAWSSAGPDHAIFGGGSGSGAHAVTISGDVSAGNLIFAANSPNYTISGGALSIYDGVIANNSGTIASGLSVAGPQNWAVAGGQTLTVSGAITGSAAINKSGSGTLALATSNAGYLGPLTLGSGVTVVSSDAALGNATGGTTVAQQASLVFSGGIDYATEEAITINGSPAGAATSSPYTALAAIDNLSGNNVFRGPITLAGSGTNAGDPNLNAIGAASDTTLTLAGRISGAALSKTGGGTVVLGNSANDFTGVVRVLGGTLVVTTNGALGAANNNKTYLSSGTLAFSGDVDYTAAEIVEYSAAGGKLANLAGDNTFSGSVNFMYTSSSNEIVVSPGTTLSLLGSYSGNATISVSGGGTLVLGGTSASNGGTISVNGSTLSAASNGALGSAPGIALDNDGALWMSAGFSTSRAITLGSGGGVIGVAAQTGTISTSIGGTGNTLTKAGAGTLVLTAISSYGGTRITGGTLRINASNAVPAANGVAISNGTFDLSFNSNKIGTLSLSSGAVTGTGVLTIGGNVTSSGTSIISSKLALGSTRAFDVSDTLVISGVISGSTYGLTKAGSGTLVVSNSANTYNGKTSINSGALIVNGSLSTGSVSVNAGGTLGGSGSVGGAITVNDGGTIAPGTSIGQFTAGSDFTLSRGAVLSVEIGGDGAGPGTAGVHFDQIVLSGSAKTFTIGRATLQIIPMPGIVAGQPYRIVSAPGNTVNAGVFFDGLENHAQASGSWAGAAFVYTVDAGSDFIDVTFQSVPEPAGSLLLLAVSGLLAHRRGR